MTALLSIKPEFAEAIFSGKKKFEYRKIIFKKNVKKIRVYATKPVGKITGEFIIDEILKDTPQNLWKNTRKGSGVKKEFYMRYFRGKKIGYAIKIKGYTRYDEPQCPYETNPKFIAPQSFMYCYE